MSGYAVLLGVGVTLFSLYQTAAATTETAAIAWLFITVAAVVGVGVAGGPEI